jgi:hypothetical protein
MTDGKASKVNVGTELNLVGIKSPSVFDASLTEQSRNGNQLIYHGSEAEPLDSGVRPKTVQHKCVESRAESDNDSSRNVIAQSEYGSVNTVVEPLVQVKPEMLQYMDVWINERVKLKALIDSGAEMPIINAAAIQDEIVCGLGSVMTECAFGETRKAKMISLEVRRFLQEEIEQSLPIGDSLNIIFAAVEGLTPRQDVILPAKIAEQSEISIT